MIAETATAFVAVVTFFMADGQILTAEGQSFTTFDACMMQAEADAKAMARDAHKRCVHECKLAYKEQDKQ